MKKFLCLLVVFISLVQPVFSASVTIENYTPEELKNTLMKLYIRQGANIRNANDYQLIVDEKGSFWQNVFFGSRFNSYITLRTTYNFIQDGNNTIVNANMAQVVNPNSAFETQSPLSDNKTLSALKNMQKAINGYYGYGFDCKIHRKYIEITNLSGDNFKKLHLKDKIIKINGKNVKDLTKSAIVQELSVLEEGQELKINYLRQKKEYELLLYSKFYQPIITKSIK